MKISGHTKIAFIIISIFIIKTLSVTPVFAAVPLYDVTVDTTLDPSTTYIISGKATIHSGVTLTVPAGTRFVFNPDAVLLVDGTIITKGTSQNHVIFAGNIDPSPAVFADLNADPVPDIHTGQSPETEGLLVDPAPVPVNDQTPEASDPVIADTAMMVTVNAVGSKHNGIVFSSGSTGKFSYTDLSDGTLDIFVYDGATVVVDHTVFSNSDSGIATQGGTLTVTNSSFDNVTTPVLWDIGYRGSSFTHHNNTFSNTSIKGWLYKGITDTGITVTLEAGDGEYYLQNDTIIADSSLVIDPGVTVFVQDDSTLTIKGSFSAKGTSDAFIVFYGNGVCTNHTPTIQFDTPQSVSMQYVRFQNVCNGLQGIGTTTAFSHVGFDTVAGPVFTFSDHSIISATYPAMTNVYQAFNVFNDSRLSVTDGTLTSINTPGSAIEVHSRSTLTILNTHIDGASTCLNVYDDSSLVGDKLQMSDCSHTGIASDNESVEGTTDITLTNTEIGFSSGVMDLVNAVVKKVSNNNFHNDGAGVVLAHMGKTVLINNFWGSDTGPTIASNPLGTGTRITATDVTEVQYKPWLGMVQPSSTHNPIIIVPGITGSILTKNYGDKSELWPNIAKLTVDTKDSFLDDLKLLQDGTASPVRPVAVGGIIRSAGQSDIFEGLIASLLQDGYKEGVDLFVLPYDWRLSNMQNQALLQGAIADALTISGKDKINIIAHSMGGLLVKDYLAQNPDSPIDHLFFIATPHLGTPKVFKALMYGDDMGYGFSFGSAFSVDILNPDRVKAITQNMPAVYELLPSALYINTFGSYVTDLAKQYIPRVGEAQPHALTLDQTNALMIQQGRNEKMFPFMQTLHDTTDDMDFSGTQTYNFAGCGATKTIGSISLTRKESVSVAGIQLVTDHRLSYVQGDGAVPVSSASAIAGATNYYVTAGSHGTMSSVSDIKNAIIAIIDNKTVDTTSTLSSEPSHCALSGDIVEVHSPVTLDIYDNQGRHTGPSTNGDIEFGIPNVDYEMIGDEKFAFLPTGPTYTVVNHAETVGTYDMYISHSGSDDTVTHETYFNDVPVTSTTSVGTVTITPTGTEYSINQDADGDGTIDGVILPSSSLDQEQVADNTPPVTIATVVDTTVTLTATDDNAGVLHTKYSSDGHMWNLYTTPFVMTKGSTAYFLSVDKAGNVEDMQQITIPAASSTAPIISGQPSTTIPNDTDTDVDTDPTIDTSDQEQDDATEDQPETFLQTVVVAPVSMATTTINTEAESDNSKETQGVTIKPVVASTLLASASNTTKVPHGKDAFIVSGALCILFFAILISKRVFGKKPNNKIQ